MSAEINFHYKGIAQGKYVEGDIEALNDTEAAHKLKDQKIIITKLVQEKKKASHNLSKKAKASLYSNPKLNQKIF